ncbi:MAG: threonylcarbamoyl-AMP synthase [Rhodocyclales bacterium]|nr:threonylcarbamoyl-AMP synthase [Rhodocyclales bacterium]
MSARILPPSEESLAEAAAALRAGKLVGMPTETVYGLAADAGNPAAVRRIFAAKGRPSDHPLIVHLPAAEHLPQWAREIPEEAWTLGRRFWPGPLTLVLARRPEVPSEVTGGQETVALRVPAHPVALALLRAFGSGLAAPSANRFGRVSPTTAADVLEELGEAVALVLDGGPCPVGVESTILDLSRLETAGPVILRPGAIGAEALAEALERPVAAADGAAPRVSGSLPGHYAPATPVRLAAAGEIEPVVAQRLAQGKRIALWSRHPAAAVQLVWQELPAELEVLARRLYAQLRAFDRLGVDEIVIERPQGEGPLAQAIADRLERAARGSGGR